jgi:hypothetical protein
MNNWFNVTHDIVNFANAVGFAVVPVIEVWAVSIGLINRDAEF